MWQSKTPAWAAGEQLVLLSKLPACVAISESDPTLVGELAPVDSSFVFSMILVNVNSRRTERRVCRKTHCCAGSNLVWIVFLCRRACCITFAATTPLFLALRMKCPEPLQKNSFLAAQGTYQQAPKTMERPQLILLPGFN